MVKSKNTLWTAKEAALSTGGQSDHDWMATGISIDTRTIKKGDLFIALTGDHGDGHDYIEDAFLKGASACMASKEYKGKLSDKPILYVENTLQGLEALAKAARRRTGAQVIAVTGSVGKTGTKEMLARAFSALGHTHASKRSYNNHWGVPLSVASMNAGTDYGIFEIGMNHTGEIEPLSNIVKPNVSIITNVSEVHIENFNSVQEIADAKSEVFFGMSPGDTAILPYDNEWFDHLQHKAQQKGLNIITFGESEKADVRLEECLEAANGSRVTARVFDEHLSFTLLIPGRHIANNALSVLACVKALGGDLNKAVKALEGLYPEQGRGQREFLNIGEPDNPVTLIDESYNASPTAMNAAFKVLALIDPGRGGRRIAVLGDMLELGKKGPKLHEQLSLPLQAANVQLVYTCGTLMKRLYDALPQDKQGAHKENSLELAKIVPDVLTPGDVVMVKGSNGSKMGVVVEALRALPDKLKKKSKD